MRYWGTIFPSLFSTPRLLLLDIMTGPCIAPGCGATVTSRYSRHCQRHRTRLRRHGAVDQQGVTAADLKPYVKRINARFERNRDNPAWGQLEARWFAVVDHA